MKTLKFILITGYVASISCFVGVGCKPQEVIIGNDSIIGKWEIIATGWADDDIKFFFDFTGKPTLEFTSDGRVLHYNDNPNLYNIQYKYRIDEKYLYKDVVANKCVTPQQWVYEYKFYEDKVRLKIVKGLITNESVFIYQKVE